MVQEVFVVQGKRTPFIKAAGKPNPLAAADLAIAAAKPLLADCGLCPQQLHDVVIGCVGPSASEANIGRIIALRLGCGDAVTGWTVQRNCASGLQAIDSATKDIQIGRHNLVLAGGTECMSRAPLLFADEFVEWLANFRLAKTPDKKFKRFIKLRPKLLKPIISLLKGLTDPVINLSMGQTAENLAYDFSFSRIQMDEFAVRSHLRAVAGYAAGHYAKEVVPLFDWQGGTFEADNGIRPESSVEKLAKLKPVFDRPYGLVTAGNSSQVTDGAAMLILASKAACREHNLQPQGKIIDVAWAGLDPARMGLGPAFAIAKLLRQQNLSIEDVDYWEINEAFAVQVMACVAALADANYCQTHFNTSAAIGQIPEDRLNLDGGAIALGHPVGASGARIVMHALGVLQRQGWRRAVATLCIGGGQGGAVLLERM